MLRSFTLDGGIGQVVPAGDVMLNEVTLGLNSASGALTLTASQLASGCILRTGAGAVTDTTDTAVNIIARMGPVRIGETFKCFYANRTAGIQTIAGGVGVTAGGVVAIPIGNMSILLFTVTGAATLSCTVI